MGKVSSEADESKSLKRKKIPRRSRNKYLKPGTLVQLCHFKSSAAKPYNDHGETCAAIIDRIQIDDDIAVEHNTSPQSSIMLSPVDIVKQSNLVRTMKVYDLEMENEAFNKSPLILSTLVRTPKTPQADPFNSESRLQSLPMDLLVKILCHLHHDQLKAVFHVSQKIRRAGLLAKQYYFNYRTPDRSRQEMSSAMTLKPIDHWPFVSKGEKNRAFVPCSHTPKAPRHRPRPSSRIKPAEMKQIAAVLFQDQTVPSRCMVPSVLQKPLSKPLAPSW